MKPRPRVNLALAAGVLAAAAVVVLYAFVLWRWLARPAPVPRPAAALVAALPSPEELNAARSAFRRDFLDVRTHLTLAEALYRAGRTVDAFYALYFARTFFGESAFSQAHSLIVLYKGASFTGSEPFDPSPEKQAALEERLKSAPDDPGALDYLAHIAADRGNAKEALRLADKGLAAHPQDKGLLAARALWTARAFGDQPGAVPFYARLAAADPGSYEGRSAVAELGKLASRKTDAAGSQAGVLARQALEELYARSPESPPLFSALAMSAWGQGDLARTRALVDEALSRDPKHAGAAQVRGSLAASVGDLEKALRFFTAAAGADPDDLYSAAKLAQLHAQQRADPEAALPFYIALYRQDPNYNDGEPAELRIRRILDARRQTLLARAPLESLGLSFSSQDASIRAEACVKAAGFADPRWIERLAELLDDDAEIVRRNADYALFQIAKAQPDPVLVRRMEWLESPRPLVRMRALNLFADLDARNTFPAMVKALHDADPAVRATAKLMVFDNYYKGYPQAPKVLAEYLALEKDPRVLALYKAAEPAPVAAPLPPPVKRKPPKAIHKKKRVKNLPYRDL